MRGLTAGEAKRWARWTVVGALGLAVQTTVLIALMRLTGLPYLFATVLAVASAILHNFFWHERWTWADRPCGGLAERARRCLRFSGISIATSLLGTVGMTAAYVRWLSLPVPAANVLAVVSLAALNFAAARQLVFTGATPVEAPGGCS